MKCLLRQYYDTGVTLLGISVHSMKSLGRTLDLRPTFFFSPRGGTVDWLWIGIPQNYLFHPFGALNGELENRPLKACCQINSNNIIRFPAIILCAIHIKSKVKTWSFAFEDF